MRTGAYADGEERRAKTCCSVADALDARSVADRLDIPFYRARLRARVRPDQGLLRRRIPRRPDAEPLRDVQHLAQVRQALVVRQAGRRRLRRHRPLRPDRPGGGRHPPGRCAAVDRSKDQSYVLFGLGPRVACRTSCSRSANSPRPRSARWPDAGICRSTTSRRARKSASSPTTITSASSAAVGPTATPRGPIVDEEGQVLGRMQGIEGFTIGQRRGLGIAVGEPRYVVADRADDRTVTVGRRESLDRAGLDASRFNWQGPAPRRPDPLPGADPSPAPGRPGHGRAPARRRGPRRLRRRPSPPSRRARSSTVYQDDLVLGGGWIIRRLLPGRRRSKLGGDRQCLCSPRRRNRSEPISRQSRAPEEPPTRLRARAGSLCARSFSRSRPNGRNSAL